MKEILSKSLIIVVFCLILFLSGCSTINTQGVTINDAPPTHLLQICDELPKATNGNLETLFRNHIEIRRLYEQCKERHNQLQDYIINKGSIKK